MTLPERVIPVHRSSFDSRPGLVVIFLALVWPTLSNADQRDALERFEAGAEGYERAAAAHARFMVGTVSLGDDYAHSTSAMTPFVAAAAQLDFMRVGPVVLNTQLSYGRLTTPADYPTAACPRAHSAGCTVWLQRSAYWSSLSAGGAWVHHGLPWTFTGRAQIGGLLRRYGSGRITDRDLSGAPMTFHPPTADELQHRAWTLSPIVTASVGVGRLIAGNWTVLRIGPPDCRMWQYGTSRRRWCRCTSPCRGRCCRWGFFAGLFGIHPLK